MIRTAYALLFYTFMFWMLWDQIGWDTNSLAMLGRGQDLFNTLVGMQFFAIYAFLPGLACGVLTAEKERDTLAMLLLTKLGPWTILVEKLLSRLMPLLLLMLLSLPLLAVAYSLGGVQPHEIVAAVWVLGLTAVQVGALAVFCSAWFRTTAGAFIATYVIGIGIVSFPFILYMMLAFLVLLLGGNVGRPNDGLFELMANFLGPYVFYEGFYNRWRFGMAPTTATSSWPTIGSLVYMFFRTTPLWLSAIAFLVAAGGAVAAGLRPAEAPHLAVLPLAGRVVPSDESEPVHQGDRTGERIGRLAALPADRLAGDQEKNAGDDAVPGAVSAGDRAAGADLSVDRGHLDERLQRLRRFAGSDPERAAVADHGGRR